MTGLRIRWRRDGSALTPLPAAMAPSRQLLGVYVWFAFALVLAAALYLRLYNVNWDDNTHLHPDERHLTIVANDVDLPDSVGEYFDSADSPLNPYNTDSGRSFVYGTLPLFMTKAVAALSGQDNYDEIVLVGRRLSALFDAATVLFLFLIGRRLFGPLAGLIGAFLLATAPLSIQHSHFFVVDPFLTFFTTAVLYFSTAIAAHGRRRDFAFAGLALGLGMACKVTAVLVAPVIGAAALVFFWPRGQAAANVSTPATADALRRGAFGLVLAALVAFLAFRVAQPYAFETPRLEPWRISLDQRWVDDQKAQSRLLGGEVGFPPSTQWIDRQSYFFPLQEMVVLGMGPAFGLAGWLSIVYAAYRLLRRRDLTLILPLVFILCYFGFMGRQFSLYLRYFLPLYPVLALLAGWGLLRLVAETAALAQRLRRPLLGRFGFGLAALTLLLAALTGLAYFSIYGRPVTRVEASHWLYDNLPGGSRIVTEHWDDTVPMRLPGSPDKQFQVQQLPLYDPDTREKVMKLIVLLDQADYVVLSSNRLLNSIPRNPFNYPVTTRYYDALFDGSLGFRLLRQFTSYPGLLGVELVDHGFEESWSSYDHPRVLVFQKTPDYSRERTLDLLGRGPFAAGGLTPAQAEHNGLMLSSDDLATQRKGGTWDAVFSPSGIARSAPTLVWLLALEAAALAVTPLCLWLFRRLPDRGYLLSKPLGLLLLAYPVWLLASLKLTPFSQATILLVLPLLALLSLGALWPGRREAAGWLRSHWLLVLGSELLFLAGFFLFREFRLANPDLWHPFRGGEKPMDLAYLTAVTRSRTLPPYDPWFAGGYINYYYLGQFLTATLSKLTTIRPEVAFNLAVPTYFALTCAGAFSIGYNLAATAARRLRDSRPELPRWSAAVAGLLAVFLVALAGNLDGAGQLAERLAAVSSWHVESDLPLLPAVINGIGGAWQLIVRGASLPDFDYWRPSRMLPPTISITEFPYFSFLFADLHAHMMAIPFQLLCIAVALTLALGGRESRTTDWALIALLGLLLGSLRALNSWDYPPFLLLALASLVIRERQLEGGLGAATLRLALSAAVLVVLSFLLFKPFLDSYQPPATGLHSSPEQTPVHQYLAHFGVLVALAGGWLLLEGARLLRRAHPRGLRSLPWRNAGPALLALAATCAMLIVSGYALIAALLPPFALVCLVALRYFAARSPEAGLPLFLLALLGLAIGLSAGVDLVTIDGDINRMNTVFKFYLHVWLLYALVAAFAGWLLLFVLLPAALRARARLPRLAALPAATGLAALLLAAAIYPLLATPVRLDDRFLDLPDTLDGSAYMREAVYNDAKGQIRLEYDYEGIQWLRHNVQGTPVIVEGRADLYRWGGRFSIYTGLPAVIGWDWHQRQQRGELAYLVEQRNAAVDAFYANTDVVQAVRFLDDYDVQYVILGQVERLYYPARGLAKLDDGLAGLLEPVFHNDGLTIFRVRQDVIDDLLSIALPG